MPVTIAVRSRCILTASVRCILSAHIHNTAAVSLYDLNVSGKVHNAVWSRNPLVFVLQLMAFSDNPVLSEPA